MTFCFKTLKGWVHIFWSLISTDSCFYCIVSCFVSCNSIKRYLCFNISVTRRERLKMSQNKSRPVLDRNLVIMSPSSLWENINLIRSRMSLGFWGKSRWEHCFVLVHDPLRLCCVLVFLHRHMASYAPTEVIVDPMAEKLICYNLMFVCSDLWLLFRFFFHFCPLK